MLTKNCIYTQKKNAVLRRKFWAAVDNNFTVWVKKLNK